MDQADEILLRFQNLRCKRARRAVYLSLLDELRLDERREVKARVDQMHFHRDILGSLPLEVAALVTSYLNVSDVVHLQLVCKRWKFLLSSPLVRDSILTWRHARLLVDPSSPDAFVRFAQRRALLERGKPAAQSHFSWQLQQRYDIQTNPMDYCNGKYAWVEMDTFVCVRHLATGKMQRFCSENRDTFTLIRVTDHIVAALCHRGTCHVWSLEGKQSATFQLPSACYEKFVANGTKIAYNFRETLYHWDLLTQVTHTVPVPLGLHLLVLHPTEYRVATVHIALKGSNRYIGSIPTDRAQFTLLKFARDPGSDDFHQTSSEIVPLPRNIGPGGAFYQDLTDRKARCNHRLGSVHISWHNNRDLTEAIILTADPYTGAVAMHRTWPGSIHNVGLTMVAMTPDILYYIRKVDDVPTLWISNPGGLREHRSSSVISRELVYRDIRWEDFDRRCLLLGDPKHLLVVDQGGMKVWCFNPDELAFGAVPILY